MDGNRIPVLPQAKGNKYLLSRKFYSFYITSVVLFFIFDFIHNGTQTVSQ